MQHTQASGHDLVHILSRLPGLAHEWPGQPWVWDLRFTCAICHCSTSRTEAVREALFATMPDLYDHARLGEAPQGVRDIVRASGGLRPGQHLYCGDPLPDGGYPFALWWPWGDGSTVSIRVGIADPR